jgi:acetyl-CoA carboxylase carboxyl transferase subunit alpha
MILDFEKEIVELENKISELKRFANVEEYGISKELVGMEDKIHSMLKKTYSSLSAWQKVQIARHPERPQFLHYAKELFTEFTPMAGDRSFGEDRAIVGGVGRMSGRPVMIIGQERGTDVETRVKHNFGCPRPEGYRKAARLMQLAEQFKLPILTFVNTPGAYPGLDAEERGQAEAIARSLQTCLSVQVPLITVIIGEGGSGGAIAIAAADTVMMLEHSIYSVISPEGCASILWKDASRKEEAATAQKLTAQDLLELKVIDHIISEKTGGAHRFPKETIASVGAALKTALQQFDTLDSATLVAKRANKYLQMGRF